MAVAERHSGGTGAIEAVLGVDVRTARHEQFYRVEAPVACGEYQWRHVIPRRRIDPGALGERGLNTRNVARARRLEERLVRTLGDRSRGHNENDDDARDDFSAHGSTFRSAACAASGCPRRPCAVDKSPTTDRTRHYPPQTRDFAANVVRQRGRPFVVRAC